VVWYTPQASVENIELYASDVNLNTDKVESDLVVIADNTDKVESDLRVLHAQQAASYAAVSDIGLKVSAAYNEHCKTWTTLDIAHRGIHDGCSFTCDFVDGTPTNVGEATTVVFKTSDSATEVHLIFSAEASVGATAHLYEGSTMDANEGTDLTIYNRRCGSVNASTVLANTSPAASGKATSFTQAQLAEADFVAGTELYSATLLAGDGPKPLGGSFCDTQEWLLNSDTQYAFQIKSLTNDDNLHHMMLDWYEI